MDKVTRLATERHIIEIPEDAVKYLYVLEFPRLPELLEYSGTGLKI